MGEGRRARELSAYLIEPLELGRGVAVHGRQQMIRAERWLRTDRIDDLKPRAGPEAKASATARLASTTGEDASCASAS